MPGRRIGIVGAGAMGSLFGGLLAAAGEDVWLVDVWRDQIEAIATGGLRMTHGGEERSSRPHARHEAGEVGAVDVLLVWSKSYSTTDAVAGAAEMIGPGTTVATFQNGLGNVDLIARHVPVERIVHGVTTIGAATVAPGHIELTGATWHETGVTSMGAVDPAGSHRAVELAEVFNRAGIRAEVRDDIEKIIWSKLAMASSMATVCAVTRLRIGTVLDTPEAMDLVRRMTDEIAAVAQAKRIPLTADEAMARNLETWERVRDHLPSMLQDVLERRRTEIDALSGAVVREAERLDVPVPVNTVMTQLIAAVQQRWDDQLLVP